MPSPFEEARKRILRAARMRRTELSFESCQLDALPPEISEVRTLRSLDLSENLLEFLPAQIADLPNLTHLNLDQNELVKLPTNLRGLSSLESISLSSNRLRSLPASLFELPNLRTVIADGNRVIKLPKSVSKAHRLEQLSIASNLLEHIPEEIGNASELRQIDVSNNRIHKLPESISKLENLTFLNCSKNLLEMLPLALGECQALREIRAVSNQLATLPRSLRSCASLRVLDVTNNEPLGIPDSVLAGPKSFRPFYIEEFPDPVVILDYCLKIEERGLTKPLNEAKLLFVGRGEVGKTSLIRRLADNEFSKYEDQTHGIQIRHLPLAVGEDQERVRLNVWDFGGQDIYHATHQFFLTRHSVYVVVVDGRGDHQEFEADYWLRVITSFAPESPIVVVLNKCRMLAYDLNRNAIRQKYRNVVDFVRTDCCNSDDLGSVGREGMGIELLRESISKAVDKLPDIRKPFPPAWSRVKQRLTTDGLKSSTGCPDFLSVEEFRALCEECGETDSEEQDSLSSVLHTLGIALNYSDDPRLRDRHILNPHWVTTAIYSLLTSSHIAENNGVFAWSDLSECLPSESYPPEMYPFILSLMERFQLAFRLEEKRSSTQLVDYTVDEGAKFLLPERLGTQEPAKAADFSREKCLRFDYLYPVLPPGLMARFIARNYVLCEGEGLMWKTGVVLDFEGSRALVKSDQQERTVSVLVDGKDDSRKRLLSVIREEFDAIHRDIPNLMPMEMVYYRKYPSISLPYSEVATIFDNNEKANVVRTVGANVVEEAAHDLLAAVDLPGERTSIVGRSRQYGEARSRPEPVKLFMSYSHVDRSRQLRFTKHLAPLVRSKKASYWWDHELLPGGMWDAEIREKLLMSDIVLLLVSPDFIESHYCFDIEMKIAADMHRTGQAVVIPVIVQATHGWANIPVADSGMTLGSFNALPQAGRAIPEWKPNQDAGWANVARGIERVIDERWKKAK